MMKDSYLGGSLGEPTLDEIIMENSSGGQKPVKHSVKPKEEKEIIKGRFITMTI